jgi:carbon storage regulator
MLTLSRRVNETITLRHPDGTVITVMIVEIRGDKARIGIDAPKAINIVRTEIEDGRA